MVISEVTQMSPSQFIRNPNKMMGRAKPGQRILPVNIVKMLASRDANHSGRGRFSVSDRSHVMSRYLPLNGPWKVDWRDSPTYVSQFSHDGSFVFAANMDGHIRIYDVERGWKLQNDIETPLSSAAFTDVSLSLDQHFLVYSSLSPVPYLVKIGNPIFATESVSSTTEQYPLLDFSSDSYKQWAIFSIKFSSDGRELVAGCASGSMYIYDLNSDKISFQMVGQKDDVNAVCFADETGNVIYSGGDDYLCRVWDKRCYGRKGQSSLTLRGHEGGITYIDSCGDSRHLISNGKDDTIKLWDLRKLSSSAVCTDWKYANDQSLATYGGHSVDDALIRCYFSPSYSTDQKYIYTGSSDGPVHIFDLASGAEIKRLDYHEEPVRDCSWHPFRPMIISSSWDGLIARWEFPGDDKAPILVK